MSHETPDIPENNELTNEQKLVLDYLTNKLKNVRARDFLDDSQSMLHLQEIIQRENKGFEFYDSLTEILEELEKHGY